MKKILLIIFIFPMPAIAQVQIIENPNYKPMTIEGIGRFKIDQSTISIIDSISKENSVPLQQTVSTLGDIPQIMGTIKSVVSIYELEKNPGDSNSDTHAMSQKDVRVFYLNYYNAGDVSINNIYLKFYRDTLIEFTCNPTPSPDSSLTISEAFRIRYGEPESTTTTKKAIVCPNADGTNSNYEETSMSCLWVAENKVISAFEYIYKSYPACKEKIYHVFTITDDKKNKIVEENEKNLTEAQSEKRMHGKN